ncbi:DUF814 domain-containing protein [candidate division KSB1 bacterium]|nr:DUF814 domain-containing protein [candidate division KSB1 bacterium]
MNAETGYLYLLSKGLEVYPFKLSSVDIQPEKYKSLSTAISEIVIRKQTVVEKADESKVIKNAVKKQIKKLEKRVGHVEKDIATAKDYESYKLKGELIQINMTGLKKGMKEVALDDIISGTNEKITVKLNQTLTPAENAEDYFKKYRKGKLGLELLKRRLEITKAEIENWRAIDSDLEINFEKASRQYESEIYPLLPSMSTTKKETQRLPYRAMHLSSGLTIFVGKDGSDNDRTTFDFAKPYELWFHTQQCPGSHVVMKFPNKSFVPSKLEIEETAAVAAFYSKARKNSMVAVIYTQRKYVRKPRKAKPGLVTVEREKSLMVAPVKPEQ